ncbi:5-carboxymethyl-2-hydroxymuconate Delta-isomerase [Streptomyces sp. NPDC091217]|uniref:5-carboxymethyl-2-hydroxymuconate Delta-isomerase n=1 Tax=Streptomyces sp. NPDC091217 TaxID=3365975 RepID=UPI0038156A21
MPHLTVDHSPGLADLLDLRVFAAELHRTVLDGSGSAGTCKTLFREAAAARVGHRHGGEAAFVHVEVGLLPGRSEGLKAQLSEDVLALLEKHLSMSTTDAVICSVQVRDLAGSYRLRTF